MSDPPWPFNEPTGTWNGRTFRWRGESISLDRAKKLTSLAPGWTWSVQPLYGEGGYEFSLTRWGDEGPPPDVAPTPRRSRWGTHTR